MRLVRAKRRKQRNVSKGLEDLLDSIAKGEPPNSPLKQILDFQDVVKNPEKHGLVAIRSPDYDSEFLDINFSIGHPVSKGIPWTKYTEREIQTLLKMHFEQLGYDVVWRHEQDPANENGVDLECVNRATKRRLLVAVKKKPVKEAIAQIVQLAANPANEMVYAYVGGASQSFRDNIKGFKDKVKFWDETELESQMNSTGMTLRLKVANSEAEAAMHEIMRSLLSVLDDKTLGVPVSKPSTETMETLWGIKDRAVTVHKCAEMAQLMFEDSSRFGEPSHLQTQKLVVYVLDYVYLYGLRPLMLTLQTLSPELKSLLRHVYEKTKIRSNWFELFMYRRGPAPGYVDYVHRDYVKERTEMKGALDFLSKMKTKGKHSALATNTHLDDASEMMRFMNVWADGLEGSFDYVFTKCLKGEVQG